jgi:hypothetical protein
MGATHDNDAAMSGTPTAPGDRPPRRLERAPGDRFRPAASGSSPAQDPTAVRAGGVRSAGTVVLVAVAGAALFAVLGSFDLGAGMVVVAAFVGWAVALAVVWAAPAAGRATRGARRRPWTRAVAAAVLAAGSLIAGLGLLWLWSRIEGGVLGPIAYADARFGLLAAVQVATGVLVAGIRAR